MRFGSASNSLRSLATCILIVAAGALSLPSYAGRLVLPDGGFMLHSAGPAATPAVTVKATDAVAQVVEFYHTGLDNFFITADPAEQAAVDSGAAGAWQRTGNGFATGGPNQVCRFYGSISPGPNSHFYTSDAGECAELKRLQAVTPASQKRWNFESNDFLTTAAVNGACPAGLVPVYRAYNNGFARGIDSNHRITANHADYLAQVAKGWTGEGIVMCAPPAQGGVACTPQGQSVTLPPPPQLAACGSSDCPAGATPLGTGLDLVNVIVEIANTCTTPIELIIPAGQTFLEINHAYQDGLAVERLQATIAPGTTGRFLLRLFCLQRDRHASETGATYAPSPITSNAQLLDIVSLAAGKLGSSLDPATIKSSAIQFAVWEITNGRGSLTAAGRNLLVSLLATAADDFLTQSTLFEQFQATLTPPG